MLPFAPASEARHVSYEGTAYRGDDSGGIVWPVAERGDTAVPPGTMPTELIAGFGITAEIAAERIDDDLAHLRELRRILWSGIGDIDGLLLNGHHDGFPGILNVSVDGVEGESLLLDLEPLFVATGSDVVWPLTYIDRGYSRSSFL